MFCDIVLYYVVLQYITVYYSSCSALRLRFKLFRLLGGACLSPAPSGDPLSRFPLEGCQFWQVKPQSGAFRPCEMKPNRAVRILSCKSCSAPVRLAVWMPDFNSFWWSCSGSVELGAPCGLSPPFS